MIPRTKLLLWTAVLVGSVTTNLYSQDPARPSAPGPEADPVTKLGYTVSTGAAPGYIEDRACAMCHAEIYGAYSQTGMARSFLRPAGHQVIEDFSRARGEHKPSKRHFAMAFDEGKYRFRRYQSDDEGNAYNVFEREVDWILGSGDHARTYLYQTESGELYQLPISYYTAEKLWYMTPGFDRPNHEGVGSRVGRECMFCHNAYPNTAEGSDAYGTPPVFPKELPEGIGCQRCHGPAAEHVRTALSPAADLEQKRASIVNPARLAPTLRNDVCYQCHLQPSAALSGVRRFGRNDYSYRPGEPLADYLVQMDPVDEGKDRDQRFEINHHPYRLEQSQCFQKSEGALACATCHDPHRIVPADERAAHYRTACQTCHQPESYTAAHTAANPPVERNDCTTCHMPKQRTQDVVHAVMTDHLIRRQPGGDDLLAPLTESRPKITDVELLWPESVPKENEQFVYRAIGVLRAADGSHAAATQRLELLLSSGEIKHVDPYLDLARGQLKQRKFEAAAATAKTILDRDPGNLQAREWLGLALLADRKLDEAHEQLRQVLQQDPNRPEANYNLGLLLIWKDQYAEAVTHFETAVKARSNMALAWYYLGYANGKLNRLNEAFVSYRRTLQIEPAHTRAYVGVGQVLIQQGNRDEAIRYYRHGLKVASQLAPIAKALDDALASTRQNP